MRGGKAAKYKAQAIECLKRTLDAGQGDGLDAFIEYPELIMFHRIASEGDEFYVPTDTIRSGKAVRGFGRPIEVQLAHFCRINFEGDLEDLGERAIDYDIEYGGLVARATAYIDEVFGDEVANDSPQEVTELVYSLDFMTGEFVEVEESLGPEFMAEIKAELYQRIASAAHNRYSRSKKQMG